METYESPLFPLGKVTTTPEAAQALEDAGQAARDLICRHVCGDWGDVSEEEGADNERALPLRNRIRSVYTLPKTGTTIHIITEWDRSKTTLLLLQEE